MSKYLESVRLAVLLCLMFIPYSVFADTQCRSPTSVPAGDSWALTGAANKWTAVTDTIGADCSGLSDDADTSYIEEDTSFAEQSFEFTNFAITSTSITQVEVCAVTKDITDGTLYFYLRVNGSNYLSSAQGPTNSYTLICYAWTTNPDTSAAWTEADVEGTGSNPIDYFILAPDSVGVGDEVRVTQAYIKVTYTTAAAAGPLLLSGVGR